jgi:hypothetical protein
MSGLQLRDLKSRVLKIFSEADSYKIISSSQELQMKRMTA